ncbi:MAG: hypothetical protein ACREDO_00680 [Methyloceanibacter sp.]
MSTWYGACASARDHGYAGRRGCDQRRLARHHVSQGRFETGWRLYYYFVKDTKAGDVNGQELEGFGEEWYLLTPVGEKVEGHGPGHD